MRFSSNSSARTELFPEQVTWTFPHTELQYCTGGDTPMAAQLVHGAEESKRCRVFPSGWTASPTWTELWTVLRGSATVRQTLAPLHAEMAEAQVSSGVTLVVPDCSRVTVEDASDDLVVRRLVGSCAHNGHWAMMEAKLVADGVVGRPRG